MDDKTVLGIICLAVVATIFIGGIFSWLLFYKNKPIIAILFLTSPFIIGAIWCLLL